MDYSAVSDNPTVFSMSSFFRAKALSERQRMVLAGLANGETTKEMGLACGISEKTIYFHKAEMQKKLGMNSVADLTRFAIMAGVVSMRKQTNETACAGSSNQPVSGMADVGHKDSSLPGACSMGWERSLRELMLRPDGPFGAEAIRERAEHGFKVLNND